MKTAMDIIEEINNEKKKQKPGILFWLMLACGSFTAGVVMAMAYAYFTSPISK